MSDLDTRYRAYRDGFRAGSVQEQTRLWRETWVLPVLDELIAKLEGR